MVPVNKASVFKMSSTEITVFPIYLIMHIFLKFLMTAFFSIRLCQCNIFLSKRETGVYPNVYK